MRTVETAVWARECGTQCAKQDDWQVWDSNL